MVKLFLFLLLCFVASLHARITFCDEYQGGPGVGPGRTLVGTRTLNRAVAEIGDAKMTLVVTSPISPLTGNLTVPANVTLEFAGDGDEYGLISCGIFTVTIQSSIANWPSRQIFASDCTSGDVLGLKRSLPIWFGADGSDANDDTIAFRSALGALPSSAGGCFFIPCGTYYLTDQTTVALTIDRKVQILGENRECVTLKFPDGDISTAMIGLAISGSPDVTGTTIEGLTLDGNGANWGLNASCSASVTPYACCTGSGTGTCNTKTHHGIYRGTVGTANDIVIHNIKVTNFFNSTITSAWGINFDRKWKNVEVRDSEFVGNRRSVRLDCQGTALDCTKFALSGNHCDNAPNTVALSDRCFEITANASSGLAPTDGVIANNRCDGTCGGGCIVNFASYVSIVGNVSDGCQADQIIQTQLSNVRSHHVTMANNVAVNGGDGGFGFETPAGVEGPYSSTFTGNVAKDNASVGLFLITTQDIVVTGNIFDGNGTNTGLTGRAGVYLSGEASTFTARRNQLTNNQYIDSKGSPTQLYGIQIPAGLVNLTTISGGIFSGNTSEHINIADDTKVTNTLLKDVPCVVGDLVDDYARAAIGSQLWCADANTDATCTGAGAGAFALKRNGTVDDWDCDKM